MQIGTGRFHEDVLELLDFRTGSIFPAPSSLIQQILFLTTHSWMKILWEKVDKFGVTIETAKGPLAFPRHGDEFLMLVLLERGYSREIAQRLNRVRIHMQVIFLSDVLTVSGNRINTTALQICPRTNKTSTLNWPREEPTLVDIILWKEALEDICPNRRHLNCLGQYVEKSHRV
jgi:hypothetical protein